MFKHIIIQKLRAYLNRHANHPSIAPPVPHSWNFLKKFDRRTIALPVSCNFVVISTLKFFYQFASQAPFKLHHFCCLSPKHFRNKTKSQHCIFKARNQKCGAWTRFVYYTNLTFSTNAGLWKVVPPISLSLTYKQPMPGEPKGHYYARFHTFLFSSLIINTTQNISDRATLIEMC